ncbi:copper fist DNA-binding domain containing protein [Niveomyces insectorum RCEF 264]|uniref:Copper fist DNA-binding domain containing protein n=1 Tax=Niveomyces insectorum RCEF 264 TaxID=1081102 RepID=A0A167VP74_9HYPO|nr:copper fist DNA-binding domain containing protein [Niveomyces insectorum RCEF 264]
MLIDGEKWACEACVRGHRVSNCQHFDRPLQHINKKGRPVTQCHHCRSQRKNRSAHIKCDCGEKTTKCVHLGALEGHRESCCCNHGGRCSCAFKKDLDTVPETSGFGSEADDGEELSLATRASLAAAATSAAVNGGGIPSKTPVRRRRANTTCSEGTLTFDEHGHHKPVSQKHAKAMSQKTSPYPVKRINASQSTGGLSAFLTAVSSDPHDDHNPEEDNHSNAHTGSDSGAEDDNGTSSLAAVAAAAAATNSGSFLPHLSQQQRRSRSETASPLLFANSFSQQAQSLNASSQPTSLNMGALGYNNYTNYNAFGSEQADQPLFSAGLSGPSVDWSQIGLDFDRGFDAGGCGEIENINNNSDDLGTAESLGFTRSFGYDFNGSEQAPTMTTGTSGEVSEAEDVMAPGLDEYDYDYDCEYDGATDAASSSIAFSRTSSTFRLPAASMSLPNNSSNNNFGELHFSKTVSKYLPTPQAATNDELSALAAATGLSDVGSLSDDKAAIWLPEYHGLPTMIESPESDAISFWSSTK